jgi:hypothetical protein
MVQTRDRHSGQSFSVGRRRVLFDDTPYVSAPTGQTYDVGPDGRFLMIRRPSTTWGVVVVLNWFDHLRAQAEESRREGASEPRGRQYSTR